MKKLILIPLLFVLGCATTFNLTSKDINVQGQKMTYVVADTKDHSGMHFRVVDRYQKDDKGCLALVAHDAASGPGILPNMFQNAVQGAEVAGGVLGAAHILRQSMSSTLNTP